MEIFRSLTDLGQWGAERCAVTVGFFDGVHRGHQYVISRLREQASSHNAKSLAVTFSNSPRAFHQHAGEWRYITLPEEKLAMLAETRLDATLMLDYTAEIAQQTGLDFLNSLGAQTKLCALCMGYDTSIGSDMLRGQEQFAALAAELGLVFDFVEPYAPDGAPVKSSRARELIVAGDVAGARQVLGHPYFVIGAVGAGKGKGGPVLGAPTANIYLPHEKIAPPAGVYAGIAEVLGRKYAAAIVVLTEEQARRTIANQNGAALPDGAAEQNIVETHLIGYAGDLYGAPLTVRFHQHMREFRDFATVEELVAQIKLDISQAEQVAALELRQ